MPQDPEKVENILIEEIYVKTTNSLQLTTPDNNTDIHNKSNNNYCSTFLLASIDDIKHLSSHEQYSKD